MAEPVYVRVARPDDYGDVVSDLVIEDLQIADCWQPEDATEEVAALRSRLAAAEEERIRLRAALDEMTSEPGDLLYPERDVYGETGDDDENGVAPLWTEAGLYGRVGKDAARTLLARHRRAKSALAGVEGKGNGC